jgi:ribosome maturation factor RimP
MELKERISELISQPLLQEGFDLVEIKLSRYRQSSRLQIFVDSDNGVKIDDCIRVSKIIDGLIEADNTFEHGYTIEVSSPGLDRPLVSARDFHRRIGEKVQLIFIDSEQPSLTGELVSIEGTVLELRLPKGSRKIELETVKMGRIII